MKIYLKALGCRLNEAELQTCAAEFQEYGYQVVNGLAEADIVVFNSCAVTQEAERKSRRAIRKYYRDKPDVKLVVTGCYATLSPGDVAEKLGVDLVVDNSQKDNLAKIVRDNFELATSSVHAAEANESVLFSRGKDRAFVKIQDGCRNSCAYCIVTVARGEERSRSSEDIIAEINKISSHNIKEIVLTGVHVGGYGSDIDSTLGDLIETILEQTSVPRIRISSLEPWDLTEKILGLFENKRLLPHMHLPLQSGSDSVLKRMGRKCDRDAYRRLIEKARDAIPEFTATTDIIVGFPGETEEEWQQTLEFVQEIGFSHIHIFSYSPRAGTRAAEMDDQVDPDQKKLRCKELERVAKKMRENVMRANQGNIFDVLFESYSVNLNSHEKRYFGYSDNYIRVAVDIPDDIADIAGATHRVKLDCVDSSLDFMVGRILER